MINRVDSIRTYIDNIFDHIEDVGQRRAAYIHSYGVSHCCALLATKRGLNVELATNIGLLHDVYSYKTGFATWHSHNGAEMVRVAFKYSISNLFSNIEQKIIKSAIFHHSNIIRRAHDEKIGCYIRIPNDYVYDGWKINFKTDEIKTVEYSEA